MNLRMATSGTDPYIKYSRRRSGFPDRTRLQPYEASEKQGQKVMANIFLFETLGTN